MLAVWLAAMSCIIWSNILHTQMSKTFGIANVCLKRNGIEVNQTCQDSDKWNLSLDTSPW